MELGQKTKSPKKTLDQLILEGVNLTKNAQEGDALYSENQFLAVDVHARYVSWILDVKDFLTKKGYGRLNSTHSEIFLKFLESDSVPHIKGGLEYGDPETEESQKLLKNIREEASRKRRWLQRLKQDLLVVSSEKKRGAKNTGANFISQTRVLADGDKRHRFQQGKTGEKAKYRLFVLLWGNRFEYKKGAAVKSSEVWTKARYAAQIELCTDHSSFVGNENRKVRARFTKLVKGIKRTLRDKGFNIQIETPDDNVILNNFLK